MAITNIDFSVNFFVDKNTSYFVITDTTNYAAQGVTPDDVIGLLRVVSPSGIVYENTDFNNPDIAIVSSRVNRSITIPTYVGTNDPLRGDYTIRLNVSDDSGSTSFNRSKTYSFKARKPESVLNITVDCISPELKSEDKTSYNIQGINPITNTTINQFDTGNNEFVVSGNKVGMFAIGTNVDIVGSQSNDGVYEVDAVAYDVTSDTTIVMLTGNSLVNNTGTGLVYVRRNEIYFPGVLNLPPLVGYTSTVTTSVFYTGNQEFKNEGYFYYQLGADFSVTYFLSKTESKDVKCDIRLCDIYCCISKTLNNYLQYKGVNDVLANNYKNAYVLACSYLTSLQTQMKCGNTSNLDKIVTEIRNVTGCTTDCNCEDSDNVLIQGLGAGGNVEVVSNTSQLNVARTVSGSTTTYTLTLDPAILTALGNIKSVTLVSSPTINVNEVIDGNGNKTYTPAVIPSIIPDVKEKMSFTLTIDYRFGTAPYNARPALNFVISNFEVDAQLDYVQPTPEDRRLTSLPNPSGAMNLIALTAFQASSDNVKVFAEVVRTVGFNSQDSTLNDSATSVDVALLGLKVLKASPNDIVFTLSDNIPSVTQTYITDNYQSVSINFIITK